MEKLIIGIAIAGAAGYLAVFAWRKLRARSCSCGCATDGVREKSTALTIGGRSI